MSKRYSLLPFPIVLACFALCCVAVTPASAHTANTANPNCTLTVENTGFGPANILPDTCAKEVLASGGNAAGFNVVEVDTFFGHVIGSNALNQQAQQAVRDVINQHVQDFQNDYSFCSNQDAKLTGTDPSPWSDFGNPSQYVINIASAAQFQSGC